MIDLDTTDRCYLRVDEVAQQFDVTIRVVYYWVKRGKIPFTRIGGSIRIPVRALRDGQVPLQVKSLTRSA
jgi:excisionase family DNA binding protein